MLDKNRPSVPISGLPKAQDIAALTEKMPASLLWSFLLELMAQRAKGRDSAELLRQWERDDFVTPAPIDQRTLLRMDMRLLEAAQDFEAIELSPLTPLGTCSVMALASQNKIVSALRGTEVVSDPTNVLALECARRLGQTPDAVLRLATCQRVVRAQRLPPLAKRSGPFAHFRQHFRIFVLCTAGREKKDHAFVSAALQEQIRTQLRALDLLEKDGFAIPKRSLRLLAKKERASVLEQVAAAFPSGISISREPLEHPYYSGGFRFMINLHVDDAEIPLIDGGSFDWLSRISSNRRQVFVASGLGAQLVPAMFSRPKI